jgi:D-3-phosphoglycerate dehydrogenase
MTFKILIATRSFGSTSSAPWEVLRQAGCELVRTDMTQPMSEARLIDLLAGVDGAIIGVVPMTAHVLENAPTLKVVSMHGVGVDHIDLQAASRLGIVVANCLGSNDQSVADLTLGLMISAARDIPRADGALRQGGWGSFQGRELWNKTLGLVGLGYVGRAVARRALGFDMKILAYDPYVDPQRAGLSALSFVALDELIRESDFISLHAPLTEETRHMIGAAQFAAMKPGAYLINTARGGLVDEQALYQALSSGQIAGAALDVYAAEPPAGSPLLKLDNIVLTPHIAAHTQEAIERMSVMAARNVLLALQGGQPLHRVC